MDERTRRIGLIVGTVLSVVGIVGSLTVLTVWDPRPRHNDAAERERQRPTAVEIVTDGMGSRAEGGPEADDGELHDARNVDVSYRMREGFWAKSETERHDSYGVDVNSSFSVRYPVLEGDGEHLDEANELLRATAMESVKEYYDDPSAETVERLLGLVEDAQDFLPEGADLYLASDVSYAVSYNTEDFISVCFSDEYYMGSYAFGFVELRTVNMNLATGELYVLEDVLKVDEDIASSFVDNLIPSSGNDSNYDGRISEDECLAVRLVGRSVLEQAVQGKGDLAPRVQTCLFVDGNGQPNLGVTYWVSGEDGFVRGWWDVTLTDEQVARTRKDSTLWDLL